MATYTRCPECGYTIGKYSEFVNNARASIYNTTVYSKNSSNNNIDPSKLFFNPNIVPSIEIIFNALEIKNRCCRMHLVNKTTFDTDTH